ncbi:ROK family transcriptional regulator [Bacillus sp. OV322]|uniref:ROK family transcriptional regulator n=1 Tax=Bacillus sp. OV322 TaxID=1882764 RepID=UPI0015A5EB46|nr:ROK family transcriptional regulator [Bacillus sp. OV322]
MGEKWSSSKERELQIMHGIRVALLQMGSATKANLCDRAGISFPTVSKMVSRMEKSGEVFAAGLDESSGGRRAQRYVYNPEYMLGLSVFLEKNETVYTVFNCLGEVKEHGSCKSFLQDGKGALMAWTQEVLERFPKISGAAFGVPGSVEKGRIFFIPDYEGFQNLDLQGIFEERFGIPAVVENDMNAAVLGYHDRSGKGMDHSAAYIYTGENGPGAGLLVNGNVVRGSTFFAGEVSFVPLYDECSFLQAMQQEKDRKGIVNLKAISRLIASLAAIINPHEIILNHKEFHVSQIPVLIKESTKYVPKEHLPELALSDWREDYLHGLQYLALKRILRS